MKAFVPFLVSLAILGTAPAVSAGTHRCDPNNGEPTLTVSQKRKYTETSTGFTGWKYVESRLKFWQHTNLDGVDANFTDVDRQTFDLLIQQSATSLPVLVFFTTEIKTGAPDNHWDMSQILLTTDLSAVGVYAVNVPTSGLTIEILEGAGYPGLPWDSGNKTGTSVFFLEGPGCYDIQTLSFSFEI